ncbi:hypothetical protein B0J13DRAFT_628194 [Dactylonectria estremocensis]|uniref:Uncharacterized protein n=1 Tax=Dactylonectria estremocensis TaxID=1079267 RepID=A0A9P9DSF2_9HYPO|nr:hypothetical protein B0J13DRAFT_628194 [Dactylonectria estremocensis]
MGYIPTPAQPAINPSLYDLFTTIEGRFKMTALGPDRWYIVVCAALSGSTDPELCDQLYLYLISQTVYSTPAQRQQLVRRLRETLVKAVSIIGVCKPLEAIAAINACEREEDKDHTSTREGWQCDKANLERSTGWMRKVYTGNTDATMRFFADHPDFVWISKHITYGLYLSDRQVLDDTDTQMVVLPGIMIQNLRRETHWHIRGTRRIGVSKGDVQVVWDSVQMIAKYLGMKLHKVPTVDEIEHDV